MAVLNNEIYIGGWFSTPPDGAAPTQGLLKWNGTTWVSVAKFTGAVNTIGTFGGRLYVGGGFKTVNGMPANAIASFDGSSWSALGDGIAGSPTDSGTVQAMTYVNGDLYVGGHFTTAGASVVANIARWDGSTWSGLGSGVENLTDLETDGTDLYAAGYNLYTIGTNIVRFARWDGSQWNALGDAANVPLGAMAFYNGDLYTGGYGTRKDTVLGDSGITVTYSPISRWDGNAWVTVSAFNAGLSNFYLHNDELIALGAFTTSCGNNVNHVARLCDDGSCGRISGNVYHDMNSNCMKDAADPGLTRRMVELLPGPFHAVTDSLGNYSTYVPPGSYTAGLVPYRYWNVVCPAAPYAVTLTSPGDVALGKDFATSPTPGIRDLRVSVAGSRPRPGFGVSYTIRIENVGTETLSGTIYLQHDGQMTVDSARPTTSRYNKPVAEWDFSDLKMGEGRFIRLYVHLAADAQIGTEACAVVWSNLDALDQSEDDNRDTLCDPVRGSYDPNDISVTPDPLNSDGMSELAPSDTVLTYQVRFQNTGTDTAFTVVVMDTLSSHLDVRTLRLLASSHPYSFGISEDGVVRFTFANILLPDSNASEPGSHGYLKYSVHLKPSLPVGTSIENRAAIYFDYNLPVLTNMVTSEIGGPSSVPQERAIALHVWPNPARDALRVTSEVGAVSRVELRTTLGVTVRRWESSQGGEMLLDLNGLPSGAYLLRLETREGTAVRRLMVVR
jgi:hypothetical protein